MVHWFTHCQLMVAYTWEIENQVLEGMTSDNYYGFASDNYTWAEPKGDVLAFVVGESWYDMFLMKSTDGGQTFEKTLIWEHPYPFFNTQAPIVTDTFYCADGAHSLVSLTITTLYMLVFGINRAYCNGTGTYWFPFVDGIAYWNENMPAFSNNLNALSPYGDRGIRVIEDYNLIGWTQDINDGKLDNSLTCQIWYLLSWIFQLSSIGINGQNNDLYLIYSSTPKLIILER